VGCEPIAAHRSAARALDTHRTLNGVTFNQRMSYSLVATDRDLHKWADLVRTFVDSEGAEVQYSIADRKALLDAQKNPEKHRDLVVRIGGHSAYFIELSRKIQDSVIASFAG
jgi:pyruvate-formate lyase